MTKSKGKAKAKGNAPSMSPEEAQVPSGKIVGRAQLFRVQTRHVTGRGRVLIATERIKRGARLVIETPLLRFDPSDGVIHMAKALEGLSADDKAVVSGLRQTPDDTTTLGRETVLRLSEALGQESDTRELEDHEVMDIVVNAYKTKRLFQGSGLSTNTTKMLEDPARARPGYDVAHSAAIFEIISSLKHSCRPAGFYVWNDALKAGTVQATRDIDLGETICISWLNDLCQDVEDRQKVLASMRGIEKCNCGVCCGFADRSDLRRRQVAAASARQAKGKMSQEEQARLRTIVMRLLDDEGLGTSAHMLYWLKLVVEDEDRATAAARRKANVNRVRDLARCCFGLDNPLYEAVFADM